MIKTIFVPNIQNVCTSQVQCYKTACRLAEKKEEEKKLHHVIKFKTKEQQREAYQRFGHHVEGIIWSACWSHV